MKMTRGVGVVHAVILALSEWNQKDQEGIEGHL